MLKNELNIHADNETFWNDSKVILGYISKDELSKTDAYSKRRCEHVQHIVGEFWSRC